MKKVLSGIWLFFLLIIVSMIAGRLYGSMGGGFGGMIAALFTLFAGALIYLVGVTIVSHGWAALDRLRGRS